MQPSFRLLWDLYHPGLCYLMWNTKSSSHRSSLSWTDPGPYFSDAEIPKVPHDPDPMLCPALHRLSGIHKKHIPWKDFTWLFNTPSIAVSWKSSVLISIMLMTCCRLLRGLRIMFVSGFLYRRILLKIYFQISSGDWDSDLKQYLSEALLIDALFLGGLWPLSILFTLWWTETASVSSNRSNVLRMDWNHPDDIRDDARIPYSTRNGRGDMWLSSDLILDV